jgi:dCMP deaminase
MSPSAAKGDERNVFTQDIHSRCEDLHGWLLRASSYNLLSVLAFDEDALMNWDARFLEVATLVGSWSKDPSTKVGAVIVGPDREILTTGFNGFSRGIEDSTERLADRDTKLKLVVHAEMNAILNAARHGIALKDTTMYVTAADAVTGKIWGGPPCVRCTVETIQAGISKIVSLPFKDVPSRWLADLEQARELLSEAGVHYTEVA